MKVVFDISVLGTGQYYPRFKAGIHRVVASLAAGLADSPECDLAFSTIAEGPFVPVFGATEYLRENAHLRGLPLVSLRRRDRGLAGAIRWFHAARLGAESLRGHPKLRLPAKVVRYISYRCEHFLINRPNRYDPTRLPSADVFHSPFDPLPPPVPGRRHPQRVLTIYDLIPILEPSLFEPHVPPMIRNVVASITPGDWVTTISHSTKRDLCGYVDIDPDRVFVTHLAASPELFHPVEDEELKSAVRQRYGIPEVPYVLTLNTLEPRKNLGHAIRSFARLVQEQRLNDLHFVVVGSKGWDHNDVFAEATRYPGLERRIIFAGRVDDGDLATLYSGALAFVYPSLYEGFGLPPLEAMQCGVPVITSDRSSLPEVVGDAGVMVDPTDRDALCEALLRVCEDSDLRADLSRRALERAAEFSWDRCVSGTLAAYRRALS
jgi:glycosyltransferase involved in cell wall biosynthesis